MDINMEQLKRDLMQQVAAYPLAKQFHIRLIKPETWLIEYFNPSCETPRAHLCIGEERALLIDPTDCPYDIRAYIEQYITDKPIVVANSHSHGDHTGANWRFDDCTIYMSELCQEALANAKNDPRMNRPDLLGNYHVSNNPGTVLKVGDRIDLGGRTLVRLPFNTCHDVSSMVLLDETMGILFTGDEIDPGQINMRDTPVETFRRNILSLIALRDKFDMVCAPHNGSPMHADALNYFVENCDRIMSGIEGDRDLGSTSYLLNPFENRPKATIERRRFQEFSRRSEWKGTALNYNVDLIFEADLEKSHRSTMGLVKK